MDYLDIIDAVFLLVNEPIITAVIAALGGISVFAVLLISLKVLFR